MKPGQEVQYTVASASEDELGLLFNAAMPDLLTHRDNAWPAFMGHFDDPDTPKNRMRWKRRGFRVVKVLVTVEEVPHD